ncbi:low affinity immunoglobulin gamma Fc region receptor II-c-like isoform X1 [Thunnus maccoyii]|uniref:low affinity immunoglobulin gamma Fc region receptor II-c-like isoform X1 n=2 Tax=Thunnus maccoyii TaxID=8240 RepID=UPI001C4BDE64|nr:low affinity immunoglobulin gamma Fc region receptor II-c-like isoform X1 [Thunnus maccoyii]
MQEVEVSMTRSRQQGRVMQPPQPHQSVYQQPSSMEITTLCAIVAALKIIPNRTQFFQYDSVSLSCGEHGDSSKWTVKRNTSQHLNAECWTKTNESHCFIDGIYPSDSGVYWCESGAGECHDAVNITVTAGSVILESPVLPVQEGEAVTLLCTNMVKSSSNLTAEFYRDGLHIGSSSTGHMTIHSVSKSDEGLYKCNISGAGQSPDSWLAVREAEHHESFLPPLSHILLPVVGVCLLLASVMLFCLRRRHKDEFDPDVSYTDVTITEVQQPKRYKEMDATSTVYSTVIPRAT